MQFVCSLTVNAFSFPLFPIIHYVLEQLNGVTVEITNECVLPGLMSWHLHIPCAVASGCVWAWCESGSLAIWPWVFLLHPLNEAWHHLYAPSELIYTSRLFHTSIQMQITLNSRCKCGLTFSTQSYWLNMFGVPACIFLVIHPKFLGIPGSPLIFNPLPFLAVLSVYMTNYDLILSVILQQRGRDGWSCCHHHQETWINTAVLITTPNHTHDFLQCMCLHFYISTNSVYCLSFITSTRCIIWLVSLNIL